MTGIDEIDWFEILVRVDPKNIFKCILVSKDWLQVISRPEFRSCYEKRWNHKSNLFSFLTHGQPWPAKNFPMMRKDGTTNPTYSVSDKFTFESKCSSGIVLCRALESVNLYVFHRIAAADGAVSELHPPPLPENYKMFSGAIIRKNPNKFRVFLAGIMEDSLHIQVFSSSTRTWKESHLHLFDGVRETRIKGPGFASPSRGMVYWILQKTGDLISYNINEKKINHIPKPAVISDEENRCRYNYHYHLITFGKFPEGLKGFGLPCYWYGVSFQGFICCAMKTQFEGAHGSDPWDLGIQIWVLDDRGNDWNLKHSVGFESIWAKNEWDLLAVFDDKPRAPFNFVSFYGERRNCVYVELEGVIFVYDLETQELERVGESGPYAHCKSYAEKVPLTLQELGFWPASYHKTESGNL